MALALSTTELAALVYFFALWAGYAWYAKRRASKNLQISLSRSLYNHRVAWAARLLEREMRMTDASLLANQERVVGFFASTTLLLLAAVLTALSSSSEVAELTSHIPFTTPQTPAQVEAKFALLILVLIFAFFKATWSLRQYGFAAVVVGSAPEAGEQVPAASRQAFIENFSKLIDSAGHDNNSCLRAYYFALAVVCWLASTSLFVVASTLIVFVLFNREFRSSAVMAIQQSLIPVEQDDAA
jgi:uncharacterized membrane protein